MAEEVLRLLVLGAHPDDAEYHAGGLAALYRSLGHTVKFVSVTDGSAGHHQTPPFDLARIRRAEAEAAARVIGATSETWSFPDGRLETGLDVRERVIREIRTFAPDLVLTHRTCDYHPDHRAVGQAVQDASYMVTVPHIVPEVPALRKDPVVAYMCDLFTRPAPLRGDVVIDVGDSWETIVDMFACHESQVFQWLPYNEGIAGSVPSETKERRAWLREWFAQHIRPRAERFRRELIATYGEKRGAAVEFAEAYEISEYAAPLDAGGRKRLFPFMS